MTNTEGPPEGDQDRLVIDEGDIDHTIPLDTPARPNPAGGALPAVNATPAATASAATPSWLGNTSITSGLISGTVGGLLGAITVEIIGIEDWAADTETAAKTQFGLWVGVVGAFIGFFLLAWEGFQAQSTERAVRQGVIGAAIGGAAGFVAGWIGFHFAIQELEDLFDELMNSPFMTEEQAIRKAESTLRLIFAVIFGLLGLAVGGGVGLRMSSKKAVNGLIGGGIGGAISGVLALELMDPFSTSGGGSGTGEIIFAFTLTGAAIGFGMGLVDRMRRDAWLLMSAGPMAGKEFILYKPDTGIGSDYRSDIVIVKDRSVHADHLRLRRDANGTVLTAVSGAPVAVNGTQVDNHRLQSGDKIAVGASTIDYLERAST